MKKNLFLSIISNFLTSVVVGNLLYVFVFRSVLEENVAIYRKAGTLFNILMVGQVLLMSVVLSSVYNFIASKSANIKPLEYVWFIAFPFLMMVEIVPAVYHNVTIGVLGLGATCMFLEMLIWGFILNAIYNPSTKNKKK